MRIICVVQLIPPTVVKIEPMMIPYSSKIQLYHIFLIMNAVIFSIFFAKITTTLTRVTAAGIPNVSSKLAMGVLGVLRKCAD